MSTIQMSPKQLERDIKYLIPNLRFRWKEALAPYSDKTLAYLYNDFAYSEDYGNNDEKFPEWFDMLPDYEKEHGNG